MRAIAFAVLAYTLYELGSELLAEHTVRTDMIGSLAWGSASALFIAAFVCAIFGI